MNILLKDNLDYFLYLFNFVLLCIIGLILYMLYKQSDKNRKMWKAIFELRDWIQKDEQVTQDKFKQLSEKDTTK